MDEARRFLRYVTPGLLYGVETLLMIWIVLPEWIESQVPAWFDEKRGVGVVAAALLASGAVGYFFATVHHWLHWWLPLDSGVIDHTEKIAEMRREGLLADEPSRTKHERLEAFDVLISQWHQRLRTGSAIGDADAKAVSLGDMAHSAGAARVASACAFLTALVVCGTVGQWDPSIANIRRFVGMVLAGILTILLFDNTYRRVGGMAQRSYERVLHAALVTEKRLRSREVLDQIIKLCRKVLDDNGEAGKDVAAVLTAAAFEDTIRRVAAMHGTGQPENLAGVINALKDGKVLEGAQVGIVQSLLSFRDKAVGAKWSEIDLASVHSTLAFTEQLIRKHFS